MDFRLLTLNFKPLFNIIRYGQLLINLKATDALPADLQLALSALEAKDC